MQINEILDAKLLEQHKNQAKRDYLGASRIGEECTRKIQLEYMKHDAEITAQSLRTLTIGTHLESLIIDWLRLSGFSIDTRDENGEQFGFSVASGKIAGHVDGALKGGPDCCKYPALLEIKTLNNKRRYSDRAVQIIKASENNELLPCISSDSSFYRCKMCGFRDDCFGGGR